MAEKYLVQVKKFTNSELIDFVSQVSLTNKKSLQKHLPVCSFKSNIEQIIFFRTIVPNLRKSIQDKNVNGNTFLVFSLNQ